MGQWGIGHMGNRYIEWATWGNRVQGVWGKGVWAYGAIGYRGMGYRTWVMGTGVWGILGHVYSLTPP